ncbi:MAG: hypothetical protein V8R90_08905 [Eubacterium sp.]
MKIIEEIGEAAMLEQLAEECTELAKAALKMARIIQRESDTCNRERCYCKYQRRVHGCGTVSQRIFIDRR